MISMPRPRKHDSGEAKQPSRSGENLNIWVSPGLAEALKAYMDSVRPRTTKTAVVEEALEALLQAKGYWPTK